MDSRRVVPACWVGVLIMVAAARAGDALDLDAWRQMPVFTSGRMMPLDTFARQTVETICGQAQPRLTLPDGARKTYTAAELLLSWLIEPDAWKDVAFLRAEYEPLRSELLGQPVFAGEERLKYVALAQVEGATRFRLKLGALHERQAAARKSGGEVSLTSLERKVYELERAYALYRQVSFRPGTRFPENRRAAALVVATVQTWRGVERELEPRQRQMEGLPPLSNGVQQLMRAALNEGGGLAEVETPLVAVRQAALDLARQYRLTLKTLFADPRKIYPEAAEWRPQHLEALRAQWKQTAGAVDEVARLAGEARQALYDGGGGLRLVPALDPEGLKMERKSEAAQPWLSLQALLYGSDAFLADYPPAELHKVRAAFENVSTAYRDRNQPDRSAKLSAALVAFAAAVREFGARLDPLREKLAADEQERETLALTAYPPPSATRWELHYNRVDPFGWSWIVNLAALACLGLAFGVVRTPFFTLGLLALTCGQLLTCYGFALRTCVTGWAPVTGMFESVVFVGLVVALLGLWFTLLPLAWPGLSAAWRLSAVPHTWEAPRHRADMKGTGTVFGDQVRRPGAIQDAENGASPRRLANIAALLCRLALAIVVFYALAQVPYGSDGRSAILSLTPRLEVGARSASLMDLFTWLVGLAVLAAAVWYVPRIALALLASPVAVPYALWRQGIVRPLAQVFARKPYALVGAAMAFLIALIAYWSPLWQKEIDTLRPVLRDRFWLYIHVLSITASYGAGALAVGLGNIAMGYYLFGRYRTEQIDPTALAALGHRPAGGGAPHTLSVRRAPEACATLAGFIYKSTQVAVVLLAAGTILGGLWADVAWGRFWGWDAKEVWALISLLVYLAILHGRYAGWFGHFGLVAGSVVGATAIILAWWGVNFFFRSGLHSYAQGEGGQIYVFSALALQWLFLLAAAARHLRETRKPG